MKRQTLFFLILIGLLISTIIGASLSLRSPQASRFRADVVAALSTDISDLNFQRVTADPVLKFPDDFGPHPQFQTEWWYYTGNVAAENGRRFGYQLTFFRRAITSKELKGQSKWRSNQIYFAHFALTDVESKRFYSFERFSREALDLSGAQASPYRVWVEDWQAVQSGKSVRLEARQGDISIHLELTPEKPVILQGDRGYSQKGKSEGNASVYFSLTRISTTGIVSVQGQEFQTSGFSWMDKEWSTSALEEEDAGWDWFSLQLDDNRELTLFQIRSKAGTADPFTYGSYIESGGKKTSIAGSEFSIVPLDTWKSPHSGISYPSKWKVEIPDYNINLTVIPLIDDQEHQHSFQYWEGAVRIMSQNVSGYGYVELTGYD